MCENGSNVLLSSKRLKLITQT